MKNDKKELASEVRNKTKELEVAVKKAIDAGLEVHISTTAQLSRNRTPEHLIECEIHETISY